MVKVKLPMPIGLAGLTNVLARADAQEKEIAALDLRYSKVQADIDDAIEAHTQNVSDLEFYRDAWQKKVDGMTTRTNGSDPLDNGGQAGQSGQSSGAPVQPISEGGQVVSSDTPPANPAPATPAPATPAPVIPAPANPPVQL